MEHLRCLPQIIGRGFYKQIKIGPKKFEIVVFKERNFLKRVELQIQISNLFAYKPYPLVIPRSASINQGFSYYFQTYFSVSGQFLKGIRLQIISSEEGGRLQIFGPELPEIGAHGTVYENFGQIFE